MNERDAQTPDAAVSTPSLRPGFLEFRHLNEKVDHLLENGVTRLFETQQIQLDRLAGVTERRVKASRATEDV